MRAIDGVGRPFFAPLRGRAHFASRRGRTLLRTDRSRSAGNHRIVKSASVLSRSRLAVPDRMHSLPDAITNIGRGLELAQVLGSIVERRPSPLTDTEC